MQIDLKRKFNIICISFPIKFNRIILCMLKTDHSDIIISAIYLTTNYSTNYEN